MTVREFLAAQGRTQILVGDMLPPDAKAELEALVRDHRTTLGLHVIGYGPVTARDANAALDWDEQGRPAL